jgi:serine protease Do
MEKLEAAIRIAASRLPVLPWADLAMVNAGDPVTVIANPAGLPWSVSSGVVSATRLADEVPGAGKGYRLLQFTASSSPGSSGGVVLDSRGAALALVVGELPKGQNLNFAVPFDGVLGLADAAPAKNFAQRNAGSRPERRQEVAGDVGCA